MTRRLPYDWPDLEKTLDDALADVRLRVVQESRGGFPPVGLGAALSEAKRMRNDLRTLNLATMPNRCNLPLALSILTAVGNSDQRLTDNLLDYFYQEDPPGTFLRSSKDYDEVRAQLNGVVLDAVHLTVRKLITNCGCQSLREVLGADDIGPSLPEGGIMQPEDLEPPEE